MLVSVIITMTTATKKQYTFKVIITIIVSEDISSNTDVVKANLKQLEKGNLKVTLLKNEDLKQLLELRIYIPLALIQGQ